MRIICNDDEFEFCWCLIFQHSFCCSRLGIYLSCFPPNMPVKINCFFFCFQTFLCPTDLLLLKYQIIQAQVFLLKVFQCTRMCRQVIELCIGFHWYAFLAHFNYKIKICQLTLNQKKYWNFSKNKTMYCLREG